MPLGLLESQNFSKNVEAEMSSFETRIIKKKNCEGNVAGISPRFQFQKGIAGQGPGSFMYGFAYHDCQSSFPRTRPIKCLNYSKNRFKMCRPIQKRLYSTSGPPTFLEKR